METSADILAQAPVLDSIQINRYDSNEYYFNASLQGYDVAVVQGS